MALPFALYGAITPHWIIIPVTAILAFFVFGIEEIGVQIEEPFSALALNAMADGIDASIFEALALEKLNPTEEPARSYYEGNSSDDSGGAGSADLSGKWTLVYTDARDITTLDSGGPFAPSKLGRIGQECSPPVIKNVIEWKKPDWATALPFSGGDDARVLQKVCCEGVAKREDPRTVDLKIVGLDIVGDQGETKQSSEIASDIVKRIQGGPAGLVGESPIEVRGFVKPPFGKFEILYLDEQMRIIQTYQGYLAVNVRQTPGEEWF